MPVKQDAYIGIDLGTTNCTLSFYSPGRNMESIYLADSYLLRSAVDYRNADTVIVGPVAVKRAKDLVDGRVVLNAKRVIGRKYDSKEVEKVMKSCRASVLSDNQGFAAFSIPGLDHLVKPQEVSAKLLDVMCDKASAFLTDYSIKGVVVTVPASFDSDQRLATMNAVKLSKFRGNVKLISEPVAAAISQGLQGHITSGYILVYDLGGGTFDVSIMELKDRTSFKVIATDGIFSVGGEDFDMMIYNDVQEEYRKENGSELIYTPQGQARTHLLEKYRSILMEKCRIAKEALSCDGEDNVEIDIDDLLIEQDRDGHNVDGDDIDNYDGTLPSITYNLSREKFQWLIKDSIDRTIQSVRDCLDKAGLRPEDINSVVMVGGSSQIPFVQEKLKEVFHPSRIIRVDPDLCVSKGAAYYSAACDSVMDITFEEGAPFNVYTKVRRSRRHFFYDPIITSNDMLPCTKTKRYIVSNVPAFEDEIFIGRSDQDCHHLACIACTGITPEPNVALLYTFSLTKDHILHYSVTEEATKKVLVRDSAVTEMEM